jgi:hypothetical protein
LRANRREIEEGEDRLWWLEDVKKDLRVLQVERWREKAVDREEWAPVMEETKALRGPQNQGVSE